MRLSRASTVAAALVAVVAQPLSANSTDDESAFERLTKLEGSWVAADADHAGVGVRFRVIAAGSVIVEDWSTPSGKTSMTVLHRDGERVIATHYCPQGNQPRLAASDRMSGDDLALSMQDITDLRAGEGFQHDLTVHFRGTDSLGLTETYWTADGPDISTVELVRQPAA